MALSRKALIWLRRRAWAPGIVVGIVMLIASALAISDFSRGNGSGQSPSLHILRAEVQRLNEKDANRAFNASPAFSRLP